MASIETVKQKKSTRYVVRFRRFGVAGKISLDSDYTRRDAERLRDAVESALRAEKRGEPLDRATNLYFDSAPPDLRRRLIKANLLRGATSSLTVAEAFNRFLREYCAGLKPNTIDNYVQAYKVFVARYGETRLIGTITRDDVIDLIDSMRNVYKTSTIQTHLQRFRAFFGWCEKRGFVDQTPIVDVALGSVAPCERTYVSSEDVVKCFPYLNLERRTILALWRFAGLRADEPTFLTRECVDLERGRLTIFSPKTERHKGRDRRIAPISPLLSELLAEYLAATDGAPTDRLFSGRLLYDALDLARKKAGVYWPRFAQSLRVSCENDWLEARVPAHVVAAWIGHTIDVQARHYAIVLDSYFADVTKIDGNVAKNVAQNAEKQKETTLNSKNN